MALSKPIYNFLGFYFENLFNHPIRTKSITSSIIAASGTLTAQKLSGQEINLRGVFAYAAFAGLMISPISHFFYNFINNFVPQGRGKKLFEFLLERCLLAPVLCGASLFFLTVFEGKSFDQATANLLKLYKSVLIANWRYLSLPVFINFYYVPTMLRVFVSNLIGFFWVIYLADKRRKQTNAKAKKAL